MAVKSTDVQQFNTFSIEDYAALKKEFQTFADTVEYRSLTALFESLSQPITMADKLRALSLFRESLELLLSRMTSPVPPAINKVRSELQDSIARLSATLDILADAPQPVPKIMHFVWVGGSQVGAIQRDYMNIWRQMLEPQGYRFNLWYDSDALLAFEMNRVIHDSARAHAMESGGDKVSQADVLSQMIEDRARVLKQQMFAYLQHPRWQGKADQARIDLMVRAYGKDRTTLEAFRKQCLQTHQAMIGNDLLLRDVRHEFAGHFLADVYQREVAMRGNFAAASDVVRLQALYLEGGRYSDMDYLPPLAEKPGDVDISGYDEKQRLGLLQLLLNHDETLMPGRDRLRYADRTDTLPSRDKDALHAFARGKPGIEQIFVAPVDVFSPAHGLRMGTQFDREMNAHLLAQPQSGMTLAVMELVRFNYDCLDAVQHLATASAVDWSQTDGMLDVIEKVMSEKIEKAQLTYTQQQFLGKLGEAIVGYYRDGIRIGARGTIALTGPGAAITGAKNFIETHLLPRDEVNIQEHLRLADGYNVQTEEELISGWTVNADEDQWLVNEQEKWQANKLKSRYAGQLAELLKQQTLIFKQGWPVIEGKPVLLTTVLQQLTDQLGEPYIHAMAEKLSGDVRFDKAFSVGFDVREQILAQPQGELPVSHGAETASNVNELLTQMAGGKLTEQHLSPRQRVMLGAIFAADSLDAAGFAGAWQAAVDLARRTETGGLFARYNAIESLLRQGKSPMFEAGLARGLASATQTARELKVRALNEPLTVQQWGERIGQINRTAQREYHRQIFKRGGQVREALFKAGAVSARQVPQDLLMMTSGDPGRRCYPLALLMAAALTAGDSAERAVIGRVANASLMPDDADARALLLALDELQTTAFDDIGQPRGTQDLHSVTQTLEGKAAPAVLLLDTGNHALLVAKVILADATVYRVYDPNFALYGFTSVEQLQQGMQASLGANQNEIARLYGLADASNPSFNVIELNTTAIAEKVLSSNLRVDRFLQSTPATDLQTTTVWEKQAVARTRSLDGNSRMGQSLAQLDARYWAGEFDQATRQLRSEHAVGPEYLPLLETVKVADDGGYSVTLVDSRNPLNTLEVVTRDARFSRIKKHLGQLIYAVAGKPGAAGEADGGSRLSFAFAIQALITEMRLRDYQGSDGPPALAVALQVQVYVGYAQLGFGVVSDVVQIGRLVRQVVSGEQALRQASLAGRLAARAATSIGVAFSVANIGFDIYNLALAENHEQRSRFSTSLAFNVAALGLDVAALAVGGAVGAVAASLSIPLLGIGIGATAIASNLGQIMDKAAGIGRLLSEIHDAYQLSYESSGSVLQFPPQAVITELNLLDRRVKFDGQKFYPWKGGPLELPQFDSDPANRHNSINIPRAFQRPAVGSVWGTLPEAVVLPCSPTCYYGYEYQLGSAGYAPFSVTRYPQLHDTLAQQLEYDAHGNRVFYLFSTPNVPHILYKLYPVYMPTTIKVQLAEPVRQLVVPDLPPEWKAKISYEVIAPQGQYHIRLTPGLVAVNFDQANGWEKVTWTVQALWVRVAQIRFVEKPAQSIDSAPELRVDGIALNKFDGFIELAEGLFRIDWLSRSLHLVAITLDYAKDSEKASAQVGSAGQTPSAIPSSVLLYLRDQVKNKRSIPAYVPLLKFRMPFNSASQPVFTTAYYDTARDRLLYARDLPKNISEGLMLGGVSPRHAWFYHPDRATVWRVDVLTGTVVQRYRLKNPREGSTIVECRQSADGTLHVSQKLAGSDLYGVTTVEYRITEQAVELTGCKVRFSSENYGFQPQAALRYIDVPFEDATAGNTAQVSEWSYAPFIVVEGYAGSRLWDRAWINIRTGKRCQAEHDLGWPEDMQILTPSDLQNSAVLFYSKQDQTISRGIEPRVGYFENVVIERDVVEITQTDRHYIATKADGRLYEIDIIDVPPAASIPDAVALEYGIPPLTIRSDEQWRDRKDNPGILRFAGVGQHWLGRNPDWLSALPALAKEYKASPFPIIGLSGVSGDVFLAAWCIEEKVALADLGHARELSLLGLTPDRDAVWLLDVTAGQLYRQPLVTIEALRGAFASGHRLLDSGQLVKAQKVWPQWVFTQVQRQGEALIAQTRDGVNLQLLDNQPARIIGVENRWSSRPEQTEEQLRARLRTLLSGHDHAPVLQVERFADRYAYYVAELDHLFVLSGRSDGQWAVFLGTRGAESPLLFDPVDQLIFTADPNKDVWLPESYAHRDEEVMALEVGDDLTEVSALLPEGIDTLLLTYGAQTVGYRISQEDWQRLACIVVDVRRPGAAATTEPCLLDLGLKACGHWLLSRVKTNVVLTDPDTGRSLIVRNFTAQDSLEMAVGIAGEKVIFALADGLKAFATVRGDESIVSLAAVVQALR